MIGVNTKGDVPNQKRDLLKLVFDIARVISIIYNNNQGESEVMKKILVVIIVVVVLCLGGYFFLTKDTSFHLPGGQENLKAVLATVYEQKSVWEELEDETTGFFETGFCFIDIDLDGNKELAVE